jgi:hypothetical protein
VRAELTTLGIQPSADAGERVAVLGSGCACFRPRRRAPVAETLLDESRERTRTPASLPPLPLPAHGSVVLVSTV